MEISFKNKKEKDKIIAIFDVGSTSVGGARVKLRKEGDNHTPIVLDSVRLEMRDVAKISNEELEKEAVLTLEKTAGALFNRKIGKLDEVICVITTPWSHSETKRISSCKHSNFKVTEKLINELINKEIYSISKNLKEKYLGEKDIIEKLVTEISLDDKPMADPIGKSCQFLDLSLSYSFANKSFIDKSKEALMSVFHSTPISFSSFSILTYLMIRDTRPGNESHLILDVAGESTDISVINKGIFGEKFSFPFGKKTLLRELASELKIEKRDAYELFKLYYQNNLSLGHREKLKKYFEAKERYWSEELKKCLLTIPKYHNLPSVVFLTIDPDMRKWFFEIFKNTEFSNKITLDKKFEIIILEEEDMVNICDLEEGCHDPFIMIEAIALSRK